MLSLLRFALAVVFPVIDRPARIVAVCVAAASDGLDGLLARRWSTVSRWGGVLDAASDKAFAWVALGTLAASEQLQLWQVAALVARDVIVVPGTIAVLLTRRWEAMAIVGHRLFGKATTIALFLLFLVYLAVPGPSPFRSVVFVLTALTSIAAAVDYLVQMARIALGGADR